MGKAMSMDSGLVRGLSKAADFAILNFLFMITCLPVFTIGAALSSLYAMLFKISADREGPVAASYFQEFRTNFKKGALLGCLCLGIGALISVNYYFVFRQEMSGFAGVISAILGVASMLFFMLSIYSFALQGRFENTIKNTVKNALLMSVRHFPGTLLLLLINAVPLILMINLPILFIYAFPFFLFIGFSLICYINVLIFNKIFAHYISKEEEGADAGTV
jgi:uncharacterized membrane protein YesL